MNNFKKALGVILMSVMLVVSLGVFTFAADATTNTTITASPGDTVTVTFVEKDCFGVSGSIAFDNRDIFSSVTPVVTPYGQVTEKSFILSSDKKVDCTVKFNVKIKLGAKIGDKCVVTFGDYIRIDDKDLSGPEKLSKTVTVEVVEKKLTDSTKVFADVKANDWFKKYVDYAHTYGIFVGTTATTFTPNAKLTRAEFVQVLANLEGIDTSNRNVSTMFYDVPAKKWFTPAIKWASENKIVSGMGDGTFCPDQSVTREQMCVMLTKYADFKKMTLTPVEAKVAFADDAKISRWAKNAVYVCQQADIVNGKGANTFDPQGTGTRAEATVIFSKYHQNYIMK